MISELYRGKTKDTGKWVVGKVSRSKHDSDIYIIRHAGETDEKWCPVIPATIGWYTYTKDRNGTSIFTDDLVRDTCTGAKGIVKFGRYRNRTDPSYTAHIGFFIRWDDLNLKKDIGFWESNESVTVIGNIHESEENSGKREA